MKISNKIIPSHMYQNRTLPSTNKNHWLVNLNTQFDPYVCGNDCPDHLSASFSTDSLVHGECSSLPTFDLGSSWWSCSHLYPSIFLLSAKSGARYSWVLNPDPDRSIVVPDFCWPILLHERLLGFSSRRSSKSKNLNSTGSLFSSSEMPKTIILLLLSSFSLAFFSAAVIFHGSNASEQFICKTEE